MEFLLIGEAKLKIVMTDDDMRYYKFDPGGADYSSSLCRRAVWNVLDMAKSEVGFDPAGDKVLVQFYPIKGGGCEVFVTKLGIIPAASAKLVSKSDKISMLSKQKSFYSFDNASDLIAAARAIARVSGDNLPTSDVFFDGARYYLSIEEYGKGGETSEFPCILEFGKVIAADFFVYICEHADRLADKCGVELFSKL